MGFFQVQQDTNEEWDMFMGFFQQLMGFHDGKSLLIRHGNSNGIPMGQSLSGLWFGATGTG